jgi:hypothetical protein
MYVLGFQQSYLWISGLIDLLLSEYEITGAQQGIV